MKYEKRNKIPRLRAPEKITCYTGYVADTEIGREILRTMRKHNRRSK